MTPAPGLVLCQNGTCYISDLVLCQNGTCYTSGLVMCQNGTCYTAGLVLCQNGTCYTTGLVLCQNGTCYKTGVFVSKRNVPHSHIFGFVSEFNRPNLWSGVKMEPMLQRHVFGFVSEFSRPNLWSGVKMEPMLRSHRPGPMSESNIWSCVRTVLWLLTCVKNVDLISHEFRSGWGYYTQLNAINAKCRASLPRVIHNYVDDTLFFSINS